ncbi:XdhC family protein [Protofrankia sp. BMG5.30]|uniref:XdhC family protein n=1 Tax=Protofrankia sp. BMG5.30 TaxID=1834514 RepID=UPI00097582F2|nr:XdhC/CoxI family protein [Protofrankia sp. BMG5.30]ONH36862.1 XshC-Cox1 family protein [Protofrankia sp. BMG5.30]
MRDALPELAHWWAAGTPFALATVVGTSSSAPRPPGAVLAVGTGGDAVGSVSGGCVEGAVYELACQVLATGEPALATYGPDSGDDLGGDSGPGGGGELNGGGRPGGDDVLATGLTCGGTISVFVQRIDRRGAPEFGDVAAAVAAAEPVAVGTVVDSATAPVRPGARLAVWPDRVAGTLGTDGLDAAVADDARGMLARGHGGRRDYGPRGQRGRTEIGVFVQAFAPPARMLVFGAVDFAAALTRVGTFLGFRVTVCDARPVFATRERFPAAHEVVVEWPHRYLGRITVDPSTAICVLTHDPKFDVPLLMAALRTPAGYIGAMGSRRTHADRLARLRAAGLTEAQLARIRAPIGLDLGGSTPEETAVSIAAEIVQTRWGGSGRPLSTTSGRIHPIP